MDIGKTFGGMIGATLGTIFGPIGTAAGAKAGEYVGDAIEDAVGDVVAPPAPPAPPPAKPLIASKTAWFGLLVAIAPAALQWGLDFDWTSVVSPTLAAVIVGVLTIVLRLVTAGAIGGR